MDRFDTIRHSGTEEDHGHGDSEGSLVVLILDTSPAAWTSLSSTTLERTLADALIFLNAHLALNHANQVAVVASHAGTARFLYPSASPPTDRRDPQREANGYRPFLEVQDCVTANLRALIAETTEERMLGARASSMSGAMTLALSFINKSTLARPMSSRITICAVSGDLEMQYIPMMNCIFSAQRQKVTMDVLKMGTEEAVFLQQASDATKGIYRTVEEGESLLAYLMMLFLPDVRVRRDLVMPPAAQVDFRAACFCHKRVLEVGFVCSVCLSIFCQALPKCITCDANFDLQEMKAFGAKPAVLVKKKKKAPASLQHQESVVID